MTLASIREYTNYNFSGLDIIIVYELRACLFVINERKERDRQVKNEVRERVKEEVNNHKQEDFN